MFSKHKQTEKRKKLTPTCYNCDTLFDNSLGAVIDGDSWCPECLSYCWECENKIGPEYVDDVDGGEYIDYLCNDCKIEITKPDN